MKIVVTGATGFIGKALCLSLAKEHTVTALTRRPQKASVFFDRRVTVLQWNPEKIDGWEKTLEGADVIINLAGTNVASGRWSKKRKAEILASRLQASTILTQAVKSLTAKPTSIITASAIGFYGSRGDEKLDEKSSGGTGFLAGVVRNVEDSARAFEAMGLRSIVIRTGIVLGLGGGALPKMILPFKCYLGGCWGAGDQWMSWISLADEIEAIKFLIETPALQGVFNLTSPEPQRNRHFCEILAETLKKPCWFPMPAMGLKAVLGQMADELFLASQRVYPQKLLASGFNFKNPELKSALRKLRADTL